MKKLVKSKNIRIVVSNFSVGRPSFLERKLQERFLEKLNEIENREMRVISHTENQKLIERYQSEI